MATLANGGTRVTPHLLKAVDEGDGWKPVPPPPPQSQDRCSSRTKLQAIRDGMWMVVNGRAARAGRRGSGQRRVRQDRHGPGDFERRAKPPGTTDKDLRDNGWFVFFAPRDNPTDRRRRVPRARRARRVTPRSFAHHMLDTFFAKQEAGRCLLRRRSRVAALRLSDCDGQKSTPADSEAPDVRTTTLLSHRLGAGDRDARALRARRRDDQQHDVGSDARQLAPLHHPAVRHCDRAWRSRRHVGARLPRLHRQVALHLHRADRRAPLRDVLWHGADGRAPLDRARWLQPSAVRVREDRCRARAGEIFRRKSRRARLAGSGDCRGPHAHSARIDCQGTRPRHGGDARAGVPGSGLSRRDAHAHSRHHRGVLVSWRRQSPGSLR